MVDVQELEVSRDVATAWLERHFARKNRKLIEEQLREVELQVDASRADLAAGKAGSAEAIAARGLRATLLDRLDDVNRQERRAMVILARWLGNDAEREPGTPPDVTRLSHDIRAIVADMEGHPELTQYAPMIAAAEADLKMAAAATKPDISVELSYGVRASGLSDMVTLMVRTDLPFFSSRRQDPVTESRRRQLDQVRGQVDEMSRKHVAEARAALQDWEAARARLARHNDEIIPLAVDRERAQLAAYQGGRGELAMVLEARRMVLEARMNAIAVETELARAWAQLAFLIPWSKP
jgi:outer membrane protein TolC